MGEGTRWLPRLALGLTLAAGLLAFAPGGGVAQSPAPSTGSSFGSGIKSGFSKVTSVFSPKRAPADSEPADDAVSLKNRSKPSSNVYVAVARLYEQAGKLPDAEKQYQMALKEKPNDPAALLGYARLKEQMGKPDDAVALYQRAAKARPNEPAVFNNLGLCYARRGMFDEALVAIGRAVLLAPKEPLYRNNIATVLVEMGRAKEAFSHLRTVHGDAAAYYNLGFLLNRKGKTREAAQNFAAALRLEPSMAQAKYWLDRLEGAESPPMPTLAEPTEEVAMPAGRPSVSPPLMSRRPAPPEPSRLLPGPQPIRLPPIGDLPDGPGFAPPPGGSRPGQPAPSAPLPPPMPHGPIIEPLPPVR